SVRERLQQADLTGLAGGDGERTERGDVTVWPDAVLHRAPARLHRQFHDVPLGDPLVEAVVEPSGVHQVDGVLGDDDRVQVALEQRGERARVGGRPQVRAEWRAVEL